MSNFRCNTVVQKHTTGYTNATSYETDSLIAKEALANIELNEAELLTESRIATIEKDYKLNQSISAIVEASLHEEKVYASVQEAYTDGKELLFKDILFEMFNRSLYLDDEFKASMEGSLQQIIENYVSSKGGFKLLEEACTKTKSPFLNNMKKLCETTARKVCHRKVSENTDCENDTIDFSLNVDEEAEYNYDKNNLGIDELSQLVKTKVLTVVKDEKTREKKEEELLNDMNEEASKSEENVEESAKSVNLEGILEEGTLFNSITRNTYTQYVTEGCKKRVTESDEEEIEEDEELDMDVILAEAITKYTLMETMYTIQLENYSVSDIKNMVEKMLN